MNKLDGSVAVSLWRGLEIREGENRLVAEVTDANGITIETLERTVHYSITLMRASLIREKSVLVADGVTRPVIAVRLTDRDASRSAWTDGRLQRPRALLSRGRSRRAAGAPACGSRTRAAGVEDGWRRRHRLCRTRADHRVGDGDGIHLRDDKVTRKQTIETASIPAIAHGPSSSCRGTLGYNTLGDRMEPVAETLDDLNADARLALYAKGRVRGKWLMTLAYDSDKDKNDARFGGVIDPRAYYTIYADRNETRYDAASVRALSPPRAPPILCHVRRYRDRHFGTRTRPLSARAERRQGRISRP